MRAKRAVQPLRLAPLFALVWLAVLLGGLFFTVRAWARDEGYYRALYTQMDIEAAIGIPAGDCTRAVYRLIEYMEGDADSIQLTVTENGAATEMYNAQEIAHMLDVRALYQAFRTLMYISLGLLGALALLSAFVPRARAAVRRGFFLSWAIFGVLAAALGVWVLLDFNSFWTGFHKLFFRNDLWLMDPAVCRMIRICPLELFYGLVVRIGVTFIGLFGLLPGVFMFLRKRKKA